LFRFRVLVLADQRHRRGITFWLSSVEFGGPSRVCAASA
jgi:hypothetical protein